MLLFICIFDWQLPICDNFSKPGLSNIVSASVRVDPQLFDENSRKTKFWFGQIILHEICQKIERNFPLIQFVRPPYQLVMIFRL